MAFDDDFSTSTLNAKWTAVSGSSSTVNKLATNCASPIWDLSSVPGYLACQVENNSVHLRQDYTVPDGKSIVMKVHPSVNGSSNAADEIRVGFVLNAADAAPTTATTSGVMSLEFLATTDGWRIYAERLNSSGALVDSTAIGEPGDEAPINGGTIYLRIARAGSSYYWFTSFDGVGWVPMKTAQTPPAVFSNVWIRVRSDVDSGSKVVPVQLIDWVKEVDNGVFLV